MSRTESDNYQLLFKAVRSSPLLSKTWTAYVLTCLMFVIVSKMGIDPEALRTLANGLMFALPILLGATKVTEMMSTQAIAKMPKVSALPPGPEAPKPELPTQ